MHRRSLITPLRAIVLLVALPSAQRAAAQDSLPLDSLPLLVDVASETGVTLMNVTGDGTGDYIIGANGNGAGLFDYDGDGDLDLVIANGSTLEDYRHGGSPMVALYENRDGHFTDVTDRAGLRLNGWGMGVCVADYDNDGHSDIYLTAFGPNVLYRNLGDGTFEAMTDAGVGDGRWSTNCAFGDYDRDGDVDLYVANYLTFDERVIPRRGCRYRGIPVFCGPSGLDGEADALYRNNGDHTFTDVTEAAGIAGPGHYGFGVLFSDLDNDGWPDIYVANDSVPNLLFHNNRDGTFSEVGLFSGSALSAVGRPQAGMGVTSGDYDNDGDFDIFVTNFSTDTNTLYENWGNMFFVDATVPTGAGDASYPNVGWGTGFTDLDNDGWIDLFVANGHVDPFFAAHSADSDYLQPKEVYRNMGNGIFREATAGFGGDLLAGRSTRGVAFGDYDNDGDIDVIAININDLPSVYRNEGAGDNHWIAFLLKGRESNRDAIGARVEIDAGGFTQVGEVRSGGSYLSHNDMRVHFGLGTAEQVDRVRIRWPNGRLEELEGLGVDRFVTVREGQGILDD